jgi:hypothetical protein
MIVIVTKLEKCKYEKESKKMLRKMMVIPKD